MSLRPHGELIQGVAFSALIALVAVLFVLQPPMRPTALMRDFNAFYCAGAAIDRGADPYRAEPLGACERTKKPAPLNTGLRGLAMPAPLPPYALAPFALLARLPYLWAAALWAALLIAAVGVAVAAMRRATGLPLIALIAAFALTDGYASLCLGQIAPLAVTAIAVATAYAQEGRFVAAGWAAALAMVEPHIGLPACIALFFWRAPARLPLMTAALACILASIATAGVATSLEYVRDVLPAHALSEVANEKQLSLTHLLYRLGVGDRAAIQAGELWYLAMLGIGAAVAPLLAKRLRCEGLIVAAPPAFALVGGPFVHIAQMPAALPAALLMYAYARSGRRVLALAIVALAVPWMQFVNLGTIFPVLAAVVTAVLTWTLIDARPATLAATSIAVLLYVEELTFLITARVPQAEGKLIATYDPHALAEASWSTYVHAVAGWNVLAYDVAKAPTAFGILATVMTALAFAVVGAARSRPAFASGGKGSGVSARISGV